MNSRSAPRGAFGPLLQGTIFGLITVTNLLLVAWLAHERIGPAYSALALVVFTMSVMVFGRFDLTQPWRGAHMDSMGIRVCMAWVLLGLILVAVGLIADQIPQYAPWVLTTWLLTTPLVFVLAHLVIRYSLRRFFPQLVRPRSAVIVFVNSSAGALAHALPSSATPRFELHGFFEDRQPDRIGMLPLNKPILGGLCDLPEYVNTHLVEVVFVVLPAEGIARALEVVEPLGDTTASIYYIPDFRILGLGNMGFADIVGMPALTLAETPFYGVDGYFKRAMDIAFATSALLILLPLFALVTLAIRVNMGSPVFFTQRRYGLDGREIKVHKFRSMRIHADDPDLPQATRDDPRVTTLGRFLRRMSIDEWPQLWNVLIGEMSMVGPRPHAVAHNEQYRKLIRRYMVRHKVRPGLTGWAQVNGLRGETRDLTDMERRVHYDLEYIQRWSPELDMRIVLQTLWIIFQDHEAY